MPGSMSVAAFARDCSLEVDQVLPSRYVCHLNDGLAETVETLQPTVGDWLWCCMHPPSVGARQASSQAIVAKPRAGLGTMDG